MRKTIFSLAAFAVILGVGEVNAQRFGQTPEDSSACIMNNSLYQEFYKQKNYKDAYEPWTQVVKHCPKYHINTFIRGGNILKNMIATAANPADRNKYIDEYIALQDIRSAAFGEEYNNIATKAKILTEYRPDQKEQIYNLYKEAATKGGANLDGQYCPLYVEATINYLHSIKANSEQMSMLFDAYDYASETLEVAVKQRKAELASVQAEGNEKKIKKAETEYNNAVSYLALTEQMIEPFASCDKIIPIYEPKFKANPNDIELLRKITTNLDRKNCTKSDLFFAATENLHKLEPTPKSAYMMGKMLIDKENYKEAAVYLEEAVKTFEDNDSKAKASYLLATALMNSGQLSAARTAAYQVADFDKTLEGKAVLLVASMYLKSSVSCASHEGKIRGAAWVAYDEAAKAKSIDPSIEAEANKIMSSARSQWPSKEDMFFNSINPGSAFSVGCWIGRGTTARSR
ncbi:MAG: tetratricopeptide repeat protein [Bacteroidales bacterium]|nr:tetratricopeptide repeat protein [Bacteroidales bacterium]